MFTLLLFCKLHRGHGRLSPLCDVAQSHQGCAVLRHLVSWPCIIVNDITSGATGLCMVAERVSYWIRGRGLACLAV